MVGSVCRDRSAIFEVFDSFTSRSFTKNFDEFIWTQLLLFLNGSFHSKDFDFCFIIWQYKWIIYDRDQSRPHPTASTDNQNVRNDTNVKLLRCKISWCNFMMIRIYWTRTKKLFLVKQNYSKLFFTTWLTSIDVRSILCIFKKCL